MISVIILTSSTKGSASVHLQELVKSDAIEVKAVIFNKNERINKKKYYKRKLKKTLKIGLFGAYNGVKMRQWYSAGLAEHIEITPIEQLCKEHKIPFHKTPAINCEETREHFRNAGADVGLSLGNGYIGSKVFGIPTYGMINIHHEELPAYQNAQSIIWQLYNNSDHTGYTIHKIDKHIDTGEIIYQELIPIDFKEDLATTVSFNYAKLFKHSSAGLVMVLEDFQNYFNNGKPQGNGGSYTTPSLRQFLRIKRNFKRLKAAAG